MANGGNMNIEEALQTKKLELDEIQKDIDSLEHQAVTLKESVQKYNELKSKSAALKKTLKGKQKEFDTVTGFFQNVDENYLDKIFPLFSKQQVGKEATA
jgi:iron-sulfur cluster repair protein YtfE (RIC family)